MSKKVSKKFQIFLFQILLLMLICFVFVFVFCSKLIDYRKKITVYEKQIGEQHTEILQYKDTVLEYKNKYNKKFTSIIPVQFYNNLEQLSTFVDYAIEKYCEKTSSENVYQYNVIESMLHYQTRIIDEEFYRFDLAKEIHQDLVNRKFFFRAKGIKDDLLIVIDTFRMKIFVYLDERNGSLTIIEGERYDSEAFRNDFELEDCVISDWDDPFIGEYWDFAIEGWENLIIPEDIDFHQELYGIVIYALRRYCEENQIDEIFSFDYNRDIVSAVTNMVFTVRLESNNRILYMDVDWRRKKFHIYEVES